MGKRMSYKDIMDRLDGTCSERVHPAQCRVARICTAIAVVCLAAVIGFSIYQVAVLLP